MSTCFYQLNNFPVDCCGDGYSPASHRVIESQLHQPASDHQFLLLPQSPIKLIVRMIVQLLSALRRRCYWRGNNNSVESSGSSCLLLKTLLCVHSLVSHDRVLC